MDAAQIIFRKISSILSNLQAALTIAPEDRPAFEMHGTQPQNSAPLPAHLDSINECEDTQQDGSQGSTSPDGTRTSPKNEQEAETFDQLEDSAAGIEPNIFSVPESLDKGGQIADAAHAETAKKLKPGNEISETKVDAQETAAEGSNTSLFSFSGIQKFIEESFMMGISTSNFFKWKSNSEVTSPPTSIKSSTEGNIICQEPLMAADTVGKNVTQVQTHLCTATEKNPTDTIISARVTSEDIQTIDPSIFGGREATEDLFSDFEAPKSEEPDASQHKPPEQIFPRRSVASSLSRKEAPTFTAERPVGEPPHRLPLRKMKKFNSCATLNVIETPCRGPLKHVVHIVAHAIRQMILNSHLNKRFDTHYVFTSSHALLKHGDLVYSHETEVPSYDMIFSFLLSVFEGAELTSEIPIISLIYLDRALRNSGFAIFSNNWALMCLGAILIASKIWDDLSVWNVDYCSIFPELTVEQIGYLEKVYLQALRFDVNIPQRQYFLYYSALHESFGEQATRPLGRQEGLCNDTITRGSVFVRKPPARPQQPLRQPHSSLQSALMSVLRAARNPPDKSSKVTTGMAAPSLCQNEEFCTSKNCLSASIRTQAKKEAKSSSKICSSDKRKEKIAEKDKNAAHNTSDVNSIRRARSDYFFQDSKPAVMHY